MKKDDKDSFIKIFVGILLVVLIILVVFIVIGAKGNANAKHQSQEAWEATGIDFDIYELTQKVHEDETIMPEDITNLLIYRIDVEDIGTLKELPNLTELTISHSSVDDYSGLSQLTNLKKLEISSCDVQNLDFLKGMTSLSELSLNSISTLEDIKPLEGLTLSFLSIEGTQIDDVSPILEIIGLEEIQTDHNMPVDWDKLAQLLIAQGIEIEDVDNFGPETYMDIEVPISE